MGATVESAKTRKKRLRVQQCTVIFRDAKTGGVIGRCPNEFITVMRTSTGKCDTCFVQYMNSYRRGVTPRGTIFVVVNNEEDDKEKKG